MVYSCVVSCKHVLLQTIFCSCVIAITISRESGISFPELPDWIMKHLLNSVIAKYRNLSVSRISVIYLSLRLPQAIDLFATEKSRYFAQPRQIIVKYYFQQTQTCYNNFNIPKPPLPILYLILLVRSPLLGACNSHNKPTQRHFYRPVYF